MSKLPTGPALLTKYGCKQIQIKAESLHFNHIAQSARAQSALYAFGN